MDRQKSRDYDVAIDYVQWSKEHIEELENTIQKLQDENEQLDRDLATEREEVRKLEEELKDIQERTIE
jgi:predicted RNase H-like nuclease (RuvC/YqgF family)